MTAAPEPSERLQERISISSFLRARAASAEALAKRGRFSEAEGTRLSRWLRASADDIDAQLHDDLPDGDSPPAPE